MRITTVLLGLTFLAGACAVEEDIDSTAHSNTVGREPIVFVHGCTPGPPVLPEGPWSNELGAYLWGDMVQFFLGRGYTAEDLHVWVDSGAVCRSNFDTAADLALFIDDVLAQTGASKVDIVAHSMGALTTRVYLNQGGAENVRDVVLLGGANHGSWMAQFGSSWQANVGGPPAYGGALEMFQPYACEGESSGGDLQFYLNGCLTPTGRTVHVDETPSDVRDGGHIKYLNLYLTNDEIQLPAEAACLNMDYIDDCSDRINVALSHVAPSPMFPAHVTMLSDPDVLQRTFRFVAGAGRRYNDQGHDSWDAYYETVEDDAQ